MAGFLDVLTGKVPQNLLDMVPENERQAVQDQSSANYWRGFLATPSGSGLLARIGNADLASQGTVKQYLDVAGESARLAEATRKAEEKRLTDKVIADSMGVAPGTGYTLPADQAGPQVPPVYRFNPQALQNNPMALYGDQARIKSILENFGPKPMTVGNRIVDANNPANLNRDYAKIGENMGVIGTDKYGNPIVAPLPGAARAVGELTSAEQNAKARATANYDFVDQTLTKDMTLPDGSIIPAGTKIKMTKAQAADQARSKDNPVVDSFSPGMAATYEAYKPILEDAYSKYKLATDRRPQLENLLRLSTALDTNKFTPAKAEIQGYLRGLGITGKDADRFLTDVAGFRTAVNDLAAQNIQVLTGPKSNFDIQFTKERQGQLTDTKQSNEFNFALTKAIDDLNKEKYNFIRNNPTPDVLQKWEATDKGSSSVYEAPSLRKFLPTQPVVDGPHKGKNAYFIPGTGWKVFD